MKQHFQQLYLKFLYGLNVIQPSNCKFQPKKHLVFRKWLSKLTSWGSVLEITTKKVRRFSCTYAL